MRRDERQRCSLLSMKRMRRNKRCLVILLTLVVAPLLIKFLNSIDKQPISASSNGGGAASESAENPNDSPATEKKVEPKSVFYYSSRDKRYNYEFRYELNTTGQANDHRLMLILYGSNRKCNDMWDFPVGDRILSAIRNFGFSILAICANQQTYDIGLPLRHNKDAKYVYLSLQIWMNTVYYPLFKRYPLLYVHGTSRGSNFGGLLCRVLPIQALILNTYPGHREAMVIPSDYDLEMQNRLLLDPTFANWFYFDFCYKKTNKYIKDRKFCPFQNDNHYFYPVPPSYFTFLKQDPYQHEEPYRQFINNVRNNPINLGGILLARTKALQFDVLSSLEPNMSYIQGNFHLWRYKPYAAQYFIEHFTHPELYKATSLHRRTCWCSDIDFTYFEIAPNITKNWSPIQQSEYSDYVRSIRVFRNAFCEEICGDILATHSMVSRNINKTLLWINEIDVIRRSLYIDDYLKRPLRIWMYEKQLLIQNSTNFVTKEVNWAIIEKEYQMYPPEFYLQDYFQRLNESGTIFHRHLRWATSPFLADYFIIPSDLMFFYFSYHPSTMSEEKFKSLYKSLNEDYFDTLINSIRFTFPFWTLATREDDTGSNHIIVIPGGRNMGFLYNRTQVILKNVIQLAFTGIRQDLLPPDSPPLYSYRDMFVNYRHHYDVILPQSTISKYNRSTIVDIDALTQKKRRLFYFAGGLHHATSVQSARPLLSSIWKHRDKDNTTLTVEVQGKEYELIQLVDGHIKPHEYIEAIQSTVFALCPEGYLPWSPRIYESIQIGAIPLILADNIVLPFERFIDWRSFTAKINVTNIINLPDFIARIDDFQMFIKNKLENALPYLYAFRWPYAIVGEGDLKRYIFQPVEDLDGKSKNVFHYISLELRCRRLEQWYGLTSNTFSPTSIEAKLLACTNHPTICPCHEEKGSLALQEYF